MIAAVVTSAGSSLTLGRRGLAAVLPVLRRPRSLAEQPCHVGPGALAGHVGVYPERHTGVGVAHLRGSDSGVLAELGA